MKGRGRAWLVALQIAVSVVCIVLLLRHLEWAELLEAMVRIGYLQLVGAAFLSIALQLIATWRLLAALAYAGVVTTFGNALRLNWLGLASGNILPSTVGGDLLIGLALARLRQPVFNCVKALVVNRFSSVIAAILVAPIVLWVPQLALLPRSITISSASLGPQDALLLACSGAAVILIAFSRRSRILRLIGLASSFGGSLPLATTILLASILIVLLAPLVLWMLLSPLRPLSETYVPLLAIVAITMIAQLAPISFNGIGIQEGILTACLTLVGWSVESAAAGAILLRLLTVGISLPGICSAKMLLRDARGSREFFASVDAKS